MSLNQTIDKAVQKVGSQKALAELMGETPQHISNFKKGRPCSYRKHAQIAAIAGEDPLRILLQGFADSMDEKITHEAAAKNSILAMLTAFPEKAWRNT